MPSVNRLSRHQAAVIGAFTGIVCGPFEDIQALAEQVLGRPIWTHELGSDGVGEELKDAVRPLFMELCVERDTSGEAGSVIARANYEQGIDRPGTCHLVGCSSKGQHAPHPIGCPDDFTPYQQASTLPRTVALTEEDVIHLLNWHNKPSCGDGDRALFHRVSLALAVTRNTQRAS